VTVFVEFTIVTIFNRRRLESFALMQTNMKKTILIVDDDITALDLVDLLFEDMGYTVERRADGQAAIQAVMDHEPNALLIDLMMPGISGQDAVRQIRANGYKGPIVAFTALVDPDAHEEAEAAGCNLVLTKPSKARELVAQISQLLTAAH
jgi:CheY-like chemotaxis protein